MQHMQINRAIKRALIFSEFPHNVVNVCHMLRQQGLTVLTEEKTVGPIDFVKALT